MRRLGGLLLLAALVLAAPASALVRTPTPADDAMFPPAPVASAASLAAVVPASTELGAARVYPTWPLLTAEMETLAAEHKDILRLHSAGKSAKGLDLWVMEIADFENPDKVPLESREVLYIDGGTHANEYIGVIFVMHALRWLATGYGENETATSIVENRHTWILPLVNPEGSMNGVGRLNDNVVNVNRNFPVGWGDIDETPVVNNPGPYPASEMETQAVIGLWQRIQPDFVLSIHCCGNLWLHPYGIEGRLPHPDDAPVYARICDEVLFDVRESCGPTWSTIYPASGITSDAGYELTGANSWSYEMSGREAGAFPWGPPAYTTAVEDLEVESWRAVQHAFANVHRYGAHPVARVASVAPGALTLVVTNDGWGNLTTASVSVADATGALRTAAVPWLAPDTEGTITLPGSFGEGNYPVRVEWQKRPLGGFGLADLALTVLREGDALVGSLDAANAIEPLAATASPLDEPLFAPGAWGLLAPAAAALALLRRRRPA